MRTDEPVVYIDETHAGLLYGVTEGAPEQVRTLIEGLQAPIRLSREVTWGEHFGIMDAICVEVLWDERTQRVTYRVPGAQCRSVSLSDLSEELDRDWERYLKDCVLVGELLGRLDAITPTAGINVEEEMTTWFDPQARSTTHTTGTHQEGPGIRQQPQKLEGACYDPDHDTSPLG